MTQPLHYSAQMTKLRQRIRRGEFEPDRVNTKDMGVVEALRLSITNTLAKKDARDSFREALDDLTGLYTHPRRDALYMLARKFAMEAHDLDPKGPDILSLLANFYVQIAEALFL